MRVLLVHNRYVSSRPSGENKTVEELTVALGEAGVNVRAYTRDSDEIAEMGAIDKLLLPTRPLYSVPAVHELEMILSQFRPDIVQLHNPYPLISPMVVRLAHRHGAAVVNYVHNYRHICMAGSFYRDGSDCTDCSGHLVPWPGVVHGCYQDSSARSAAMALALGAHKSTWKLVDRFVAISDYVRQVLVANKFPADRISVVRNAVDEPRDRSPLGRGFVFTGRLDQTKGVGLLVEAWTRTTLGQSINLHIAGDGPMRGLVDNRQIPGLLYHGSVGRSALNDLIDASAVAVVPSTWQEPFGRTAIEALSRARPVIATDVGGLPEIVSNDVGWLSEREPSCLAARLVEAASSASLVAMSIAAQRRFAKYYSRTAQISSLLSVYDQVMASRLSERRA